MCGLKTAIYQTFSFAESSLYRVEFISCKLLGTNLSETTMNHVLLHDCNAGYINLAMSKMNQVRFAHSQLRNGSLNDCRFSSIAFDSCDLVEADFSHASLRGIDLRTSRISGITLNISDLKGAVIHLPASDGFTSSVRPLLSKIKKAVQESPHFAMIHKCVSKKKPKIS